MISVRYELPEQEARAVLALRQSLVGLSDHHRVPVEIIGEWVVMREPFDSEFLHALRGMINSQRLWYPGLTATVAGDCPPGFSRNSRSENDGR